jgi:NADPH:quinone reductase-like Zn-dependent oxidoreductase
MKAAIVTKGRETPSYGNFEEPTPAAGETKIAVTAAALSHATRGRASGAHYSSSGRFPFVAGIDGVGRTESGQRVYFVLPTAPLGAMAEQTIVPISRCVPLPDGLDDVTAAALANPGMSSWAALTERARLVAGETVLVNGATGVAGRLAIQIAKHLGAKKVIATGRDAQALEALPALGADVVISLAQEPDALEQAFQEQFSDQFGGDGVDIVLDYLWGPSAERLLVAGAKAGKDTVPIRFVEIGAASAPDLVLPAAVLRSASIQLMGSGIGSISVDTLVSAAGEVLRAALPAKLEVTTRAVPLADLETTWSADGGTGRIVYTMG